MSPNWVWCSHLFLASAITTSVLVILFYSTHRLSYLTVGQNRSLICRSNACISPVSGTRLHMAEQESECFRCLQQTPLRWSGTPTERMGMLELNGLTQTTRHDQVGAVPHTMVERKCVDPVPGVRENKVRQCWDYGWLELGGTPALTKFDSAKARKCLANKHIVFAGNSITRYMAWALINLASDNQLQRQFPDISTQLWGSHAAYFTKSWSLEEAAKNGPDDPVKIWRMHTPTHNSPSDPDGRQDSAYWVSSINLNVTFGHILEFEDGPGEYPGNPWDAIERSKREFDAKDPSLIVFSMGLRSLTSTSLPTYPKNVVKSLTKLRHMYPKSALLYQLVGASFDELRKAEYTPQFQQSITAHNMAVLQLLSKTENGFPAFTINELQAQEENSQATLDGIHFLEGTGVNEALVQVLLNRLC